ncbi:mismatch-specific DNA-glycosylase [Deinococcus pimensis]|uniref:mismatch-specific DNA-glycosylase n=1 Tax=Deinococcus pimensis TaxID=309888 RepID=UPI00048732B6|nr:mismatch-specific DNA-glycosylase [Deinococcus pimensis]
MTLDYIVPDLLREDLTLVFCGTAPSLTSARERAYYAHPQNKFWPTLHRVGLTPRRLRPTEYPLLLDLDIGLTDVAKRHSGIDSALPREAFAPLELHGKIERYRPRLVAFTSKRAASEALGVPTGRLPYGPQARDLEGTELWVLPSTSPLGDNHFRIEPWEALAARYRELRAGG